MFPDVQRENCLKKHMFSPMIVTHHKVELLAVPLGSTQELEMYQHWVQCMHQQH